MNIQKLTRLAALTLLLAAAQDAAAQSASRYIPYKGQLERSGAPMTGTVNMTFSLWDALANGNQLHTETKQVVVTGGNFSVQIGPVADTVFDTAALHLELAVEGTTLGGRQLIQTSAYAVRGQPGAPFKADALQSEQLTLSRAGTQITMQPVSTVSSAGVGVDIPGDIILGGGISSVKLGAPAPIPNATTSNFAAGALSGTFSDPGGTIVIFASATGYCSATGSIRMQVYVDGTVMGSLRAYCSVANVHTTFPTGFIRINRGIIAVPPTPTTRTVELRPIDCASGCAAGIVTTRVDANDFGEVTVIRLPTP